MKKASKELEQAFWEGIKHDRDMHKHSRRLLKVLATNDGDVKKTVVQWNYGALNASTQLARRALAGIADELDALAL